MTVQGTMTGNTSRGEHADELFHPKPAKAPLGYPVVKTGQTRPSAVRFKTGQSALGSDAPSEPPSRLVKATRRNYCESSCSNHVHWPVLKRPSVAGFQAPLDTSRISPWFAYLISMRMPGVPTWLIHRVL